MADNLDLIGIPIRNIPTNGKYEGVSGIDKDLQELLRGTKSVLSPNDYVRLANKEVTSKGGLSADIIIESKNLDKALIAIDEILGGLGISTGASYERLTEQKMPIISGFEDIQSAEAIKLARKSIESAGGEIVHQPTVTNPNRYFYRVPYTGKDSEAFVNSLLEPSRELTGTIEDRQGVKESKANTRKIIGFFTKLLGVVLTLTDIARRILTVVTEQGKEAVKESINAHNLGISHQQMREIKSAERVLGAQGVITGSIQDIQSMFGNITNIDEGALESLALIMGAKIEDLVKSGIGGSDPYTLMGEIIDSFNQRVKEGRNSIGDYVGEQQARRELYSLLQRVSPNLAGIFALMQEQLTQGYGIYQEEAKGSTLDFLNAINQANRGEYSLNQESLLKQEALLSDRVKDLIEQMKHAIAIKFAPEAIAVLRTISNVRFGLSGQQNIDMNYENARKNQAYRDRMQLLLANLPTERGDMSFEEWQRVLSKRDFYENKLKEIAEQESKKLKGKPVKDVTMTLLEEQALINEMTEKNIKGKAKAVWRAQGSEDAEFVKMRLSNGDLTSSGYTYDAVRQALAYVGEKSPTVQADYERHKKDLIEQKTDLIEQKTAEKVKAEEEAREKQAEVDAKQYEKKYQKAWQEAFNTLSRKEQKAYYSMSYNDYKAPREKVANILKAQKYKLDIQDIVEGGFPSYAFNLVNPHKNANVLLSEDEIEAIRQDVEQRFAQEVEMDALDYISNNLQVYNYLKNIIPETFSRSGIPIDEILTPMDIANKLGDILLSKNAQQFTLTSSNNSVNGENVATIKVNINDGKDSKTFTLFEQGGIFLKEGTSTFDWSGQNITFGNATVSVQRGE